MLLMLNSCLPCIRYFHLGVLRCTFRVFLEHKLTHQCIQGLILGNDALLGFLLLLYDECNAADRER